MPGLIAEAAPQRPAVASLATLHALRVDHQALAVAGEGDVARVAREQDEIELVFQTAGLVGEALTLTCNDKPDRSMCPLSRLDASTSRD